MRASEDEAVALCGEVTRVMSSGDFDITLILRRCQFACQLVEWSDARDWFQRELGGYPEGVATPPHRIVQGVESWRVRGMEFALEAAVSSVNHGRELFEPEAVAVTLEARGTIDSLIAAAETGYEVVLPGTKTGWSKLRRTEITLERMKSFPAPQFRALLKSIERMTFDFASRSYTVLRYSNVLTDIWHDYRVAVDTALTRMQLDKHLDAIQKGVGSDNPEIQRAAAFACRNLLTDLAAYLWRDARNTYDLLPGGQAKGDKLVVTPDKFANRLRAYLHQKGLHITAGGQFLRDEMDRLATSIRSLVAFQI